MLAGLCPKATSLAAVRVILYDQVWVFNVGQAGERLLCRYFMAEVIAIELSGITGGPLVLSWFIQLNPNRMAAIPDHTR
jgi:hypothetical protein